MPTSSRRDGPALMLRSCVFLLGAGRPDWGRAMLAELAHVHSRRRRWAFAFGGIRALAFTMPPSGAQRVVTSGALVAAVGSLFVVAVGFLRYPGMASGARTWVAVVIFAALLTTYVVVARAAGDRLVDTRLTLASTFAGALIAASWLAIGLDSSVDGPSALTVPLLVLGPVVALALGYLTTTISGSIRSGAGHVGLTALTAGFALFLVWAGWTVTAAGRPYDAALLRDFRSSGFADVSTYAVNDSLGTAMMLLVLVPLLSATSGLVGAATARIRSADRPS